ncbi:MAG: NADH:flavin oxidoreductase/NADH oxidase [Actinomycetota bacterium]
MSLLYTPLTLRGTTTRNRVWVSPMCQYSAVDGVPQDWHLVHLGGFAVGGAGLVLTEATAVSPEGRISPADTGLYDDAQVDAWRRIVDFVRAQGAVPGVQLAHAGRKASVRPPWQGGTAVPPAEGGWPTVAPSPIPFGGLPAPRELTDTDLRRVRADVAAAARRALAAGFEVVEVHMAHGYLLHEFLSPLANRRTDGYGGPFENRVRFPLEVVDVLREVLPERLPLLVRVSATDWVDGGWSVDETVAFARLLAEHGVDLVDCSSGGLVPDATIPAAPGYQVPFAERVRREAGVPTAAVGLLTDAKQAEDLLAVGAADAVVVGRELLRDPHTPLRWAHDLGVDVPWPVQYERARPRR